MAAPTSWALGDGDGDWAGSLKREDRLLFYGGLRRRINYRKLTRANLGSRRLFAQAHQATRGELTFDK